MDRTLYVQQLKEQDINKPFQDMQDTFVVQTSNRYVHHHQQTHVKISTVVPMVHVTMEHVYVILDGSIHHMMCAMSLLVTVTIPIHHPYVLQKDHVSDQIHVHVKLDMLAIFVIFIHVLAFVLMKPLFVQAVVTVLMQTHVNVKKDTKGQIVKNFIAMDLNMVLPMHVQEMDNVSNQTTVHVIQTLMETNVNALVHKDLVYVRTTLPPFHHFK